MQRVFILASHDSKKNIEEEKGSFWCYHRNINAIKKSPFKLHISISHTWYAKMLPIIKSELLHACENDVINSFKYLRETDSLIFLPKIEKRLNRLRYIEFMMDCIKFDRQIPFFLQEIFKKYGYESNSENTECFNLLTEAKEEILDSIVGYKRAAHNPITLYLSPDVDVVKLAKWCLKIEDLLKDMPIQRNTLSEADISLFTHISFRRDRLNNNKYIPIRNSNIPELKCLRESAEKSKFYASLTTVLDRLQKLDDVPCIKPEVLNVKKDREKKVLSSITKKKVTHAFSAIYSGLSMGMTAFSLFQSPINHTQVNTVNYIARKKK